MESKQKVLLCGDVEGKFCAFFDRIDTINKKNGPFELVLCVGNFFGVNNREFQLYKNGERKVAVPTYVLGSNKNEHNDLFPENGELCPNVFCLGKRGLYTSSGGLKIAYISGTAAENEENAHNFTVKDAAALFDVCVRGNSNFRGVDVLLTSQWPSGVTQTNEHQPTSASDLVSWLIMKLKPRYHVGGLEGVYYESAPFRCPNQEGVEITTRFVGLARVGNPKKQKWIYALSLTPLEKMKIADLLQKTTDEIACPFNFDELESKIFKKKRKTVTANQYFYDANAEEEKSGGKRRKRERVAFDQSKCWFCLASPSVEKHLVIAVGDATYLALAKGGLVDEHFLICPIEHHQSTLTLPQNALQEIQQFKDALRRFYDRNDTVPVFFERNYKTSHMQLQAVPIQKKATRELKEIFAEEAEAHGFKLDELEAQNRLEQVVPPGVPFFAVELPEGASFYVKIQGKSEFPLNFAREVLATGPVLDRADRVDWKECVLKREEEEALVQRIRTDFEPYDFNQ